ncbi:MAG: hypothetical protein AAF467_17280 [Actinomycetota bacterium]
MFSRRPEPDDSIFLVGQAPLWSPNLPQRVAMQPRFVSSWLATMVVLAALLFPPVALAVRAGSEFFDYSMRVRYSEIPILMGLVFTAVFGAAVFRVDRMYRSRWDPFAIPSTAVRLVELSWLGVGEMSNWTVAGVDGTKAALPVPLPIPEWIGPDPHDMATPGDVDSGGRSSSSGPARPELDESWREHRAVRGDTWWSLAEHHFGDGERWREIADANQHREVSPGVVCARGDSVLAGWIVMVPIAEVGDVGDQQPDEAAADQGRTTA